MSIPKLARDLTGQKFGMLTALEYSRSDNGAYWVFLCDCGVKKVLRSSFVSRGHTNSCGCQSAANRFYGPGVIEGQKFGEITAVKLAGKSGHNLMWECLCYCGTQFNALASNLRSGNTKSCGCHRRKVSAQMLRKHGLSHTAAYGLWNNMMRRCYAKKNPAYPSYGGRGITVCERWHNFENFYSDMGDRPAGRSLDRRNNDGPYAPENCHWATQKQQGRNTRVNVIIEIDGLRKTIAEWAEIAGIPDSRIRARRKMGWKDEELLLPKRPKR